MNQRRRKKLNELTVVGVFFAVVALGLVYAFFHLDLAPAPSTAPVPAVLAAPTLEAYQHDAKAVLGPFLEQAARIAPADISTADPTLAELVDKTRDRMLRLRLPGEAKDFHWSAVRLLDEWRRALRGSSGDGRDIMDSTERLLAANPWLR